jgi:hypothetical protein
VSEYKKESGCDEEGEEKAEARERKKEEKLLSRRRKILKKRFKLKLTVDS